jgi:hypothetical protein
MMPTITVIFAMENMTPVISNGGISTSSIIPYNVLWNWAQYFEPGIALEVGDFRFKPVGVVSIEAAGQRTVFEKDEYALFHIKWMFDSENRKWFPVVT